MDYSHQATTQLIQLINRLLPLDLFDPLPKFSNAMRIFPSVMDFVRR
jgi:hypothetical protein